MIIQMFKYEDAGKILVYLAQFILIEDGFSDRQSCDNSTFQQGGSSPKTFLDSQWNVDVELQKLEDTIINKI